MKTITVITPANIEVEYRLAGAGSRLAAFTVDFLLQTVACLIVAAIFLFSLQGFDFSAWGSIGGYTVALLILLVFSVYAGYFIICEMRMNGQSVGKRIFGLRVIRDNGQPVTFMHSLIRNLFKIALDMLYIGLFVILFSKKHKRLGDIAAGTVVVAERYETYDTTLASYYAHADTHKNIRYPHITLTDEERQMLRSYVRRQDILPAHIRPLLTAYFSKKWGVHEDLLDDEVLAYLADVND